MPTCAACGQIILFGGKRLDNAVFCNDKCLQRGVVNNISHQVPDDLITQTAFSIHTSNCPKCGGPGPVDVHNCHKITSFIVMTRWSTTPNICCRSCGTKVTWGAIGWCIVAGWWGFPWGIIGTPIQIVRNITALCQQPDPRAPSQDLMVIARKIIAARAYSAGMQNTPPPGPRGFEVVNPRAVPPPLPPSSEG